jgi:two-component system OmpR family sensor kinase
VSLRLRLALWYGALTGVVVLFVCGYGYAVHARAHYDQTDAVLHGVAERAVLDLRGMGAAGDTARAIAASHALGAYVSVLGADGRVLAAAPEPAPAVPAALLRAGRSQPAYSGLARLAPALHEGAGTAGVFGSITTRSGRWRVLARPDSLGGRVMSVAMPLAVIDHSVAAFGQLMLLMAAVGIAAAFVLGWLVAGRALRPVASLTQAASHIARSRELARRVPERRSRDELATLARTFNEMLDSLQRAHVAQQRFVADASHELRAPLTIIHANLELLRRGDALPPGERVSAILEAHTEAERLARLVADLLALARADAGLPIRRVPVELDRVLLDVVGEARHLTDGQRLEIAQVEPLVVDGDPDRLRQLVLILLDNAIRYTPAPGRVVVALRRAGTTAELEVRDEGVGIAAEDLPRVFERFYRADRARSRDPGGSGLGLAIAQWIVARHDGTVTLRSRPGEGTVAAVVLSAAA